MHLTTIITKKGKEYVGYVDRVRIKKGTKVGYVYLYIPVSGKTKKIFIEEMTGATTEHERISVNQPDATKDNLGSWKESIEKGWVREE